MYVFDHVEKADLTCNKVIKINSKKNIGGNHA